jgi:hypothetical protein
MKTLWLFLIVLWAGAVSAQTGGGAVGGNTTDGLNSSTMRQYLTIVKSDAVAQVIIPGTAGPRAVPSSIIQAPAPEMVYLHATDNIPRVPLMVVRDPSTGNFTINLKSDFYIAGVDGLTGCSLLACDLFISKPLMVIPGSPWNSITAVTQFTALWSEEKLVRQLDAGFEPPFPGKVFLREAANQGFFQGDSDPNSQQLAAATLKSYSVIDGILQLELSSPKNVFVGDFWIDLKTMKVIKSTIDGQAMDLSTGGPYAVPMKQN